MQKSAQENAKIDENFQQDRFLGKTISASELISELKSSSSRWIKSKGDQHRSFCWQSGYGGFSVSRPNVQGVIEYISKQKEHHKTISFRDELLAMLQRAQIDYDEKYLWDQKCRPYRTQDRPPLLPRPPLRSDLGYDIAALRALRNAKLLACSPPIKKAGY